MKMKRETINKAKIMLAVAAALFAVTACGKGAETPDETQMATPEVLVPTPDPTPRPTLEPTKPFRTDRFKFEVPKSWGDDFEIEEKEENGVTYTVFYAKKCHEETGEGWLFSIGEFEDESYKEVVSYGIAGRNGTITYAAIYPDKIQTVGASEAAKEQYNRLIGSVERVAASLVDKKKEEQEKKEKKNKTEKKDKKDKNQKKQKK